MALHYADGTLIASSSTLQKIQGALPPDTTPPTPDPATFASAPAAVSDTQITMTATTGSDASGPVEYLFDETSGNPGGTDSGWTTNPVYNDTGLSADTQYTYTVQMRDSRLRSKNTDASIISSPLFIKVAESTVTLLPISQVG